MKYLFIIVSLCCLAAFTAAQVADQTFDEREMFLPTGPKDVGAGEIQSPPGDPLLTGDCTDYIDLSGQPLPILATGTTVGATNNYGPYPSRPPNWAWNWFAASSAGPDRTYKWTAPADGHYVVSLAGSSYDTGLEIYNFTCPTEPSYPADFIAGSDDIGPPLQSCLIYMGFTAGQEILIVVDGYGSNAGAYQLRIRKYSTADPDSFIVANMASRHVPGLSASAVHDGNVVWSGNYGHANIAQDIATTDSTLFILASVSKTVVGIALMQLWEDGLFNLDDNINLYLPWTVRNPYYPSSPITFRMLMTHTSGILDNWSVLNSLVTWGSDSPIALSTFLSNYLVPGGTYYNASANFGNYVPGTVFNYSNVGAALGGYLVERTNPGHLSFEQYCQQYIFGPLGMDNTSWFLANLNVNDIAIPYHANGITPYQHYGFPDYPDGQLRTSSYQLARHMTAMMQHGQIEGTRILDSTTVELMTTVQFPNVAQYCGLFWMGGSFGNGTIWGHTGGYYGCRTEMFYCPEENTGVVVLTNGESNALPDTVFWEIFNYVSEVVLAPPAAPQALTILITNEEAHLNWQPSAGATVYHIYGTATPDGTGDILASVSDTTWTDPDFASRPLTFFYYVTAE